MLPDKCGGCIYWQPEGTLCRRHAPSPSNQAREVSHWPLTKESDRCGSGSDGNDDDALFVRCQRCIHWYQPEGEAGANGRTPRCAAGLVGGERVLHPLRPVAWVGTRAASALACHP